MPIDNKARMRLDALEARMSAAEADIAELSFDLDQLAGDEPAPPPPPPADDPPPVDEPEPPSPPPVVPQPTGLWALSAKARANGLGVNLGDFNAWDTTWPFSDLLQQAQFRNSTYGYTSPGHVASQEVLLMIGHDLAGLMPWGQFTFTNSGTAKIHNPFPSTKSNEGIQLRFGPGSIADDCSLFVNGWHGVNGFDQTFLDRLAPVAGYVRFMDWMRCNNSQKQNWADEYQGDKWFAYYGVTIEKMIALCNLIGAWPWFCIPHKATDDYVRKLVQLVRANLRPELTPIFEFSNEIWNGGFQQSSMGIAGGANRARQVMAIVKQETLGASIRIVATQEDNIGVSDIVLSGDCSMFTHLAAGWYLGPWMGNSASTPTDPQQILDKARADIPRLIGNLQQHKAKAHAKGLQLCGYEGGFHLVGVGQYTAPYYERFKAAVRHPSAGAVEHELREAVAPLMDFALAYTFCGRDNQHGLWGMLNYIHADLTTQYRYQSFYQDAQA